MQMNRGEAVFDGTHTVDMSDGIFQKLGSFVEETTGIKMPPSKKTMLEGRLRKRLRVLEIAGFKEYCDYVLSQKDGGAELVDQLLSLYHSTLPGVYLDLALPSIPTPPSSAENSDCSQEEMNASVYNTVTSTVSGILSLF